MYRKRSISEIVCVLCMFQVLVKYFQVVVKPCWYCWLQFLLPHNQVGRPTWRHLLVLFLIIINLIIFHHTNSCCALYSPSTTTFYFELLSPLKVFQPVKACVAVKLLNLVVIPYLRYFPKMWYIFRYLRYSPQNVKCYRQHKKQLAVSGLKSFVINNMLLWRNAENILADFSEAIKITQDHLWWW